VVKTDASENVARQIVENFRELQEIRSKSSAHRKSSKSYPKLLKEFQLEGLDNKEKFNKITNSVNIAFSLILECDFKK